MKLVFEVCVCVKIGGTTIWRRNDFIMSFELGKDKLCAVKGNSLNI